MKLGYNQATCMGRSSLERDLVWCEEHGYEAIEIRLDMLRDYLTRHRLVALKTFFGGSSVKPYALNAIEPINFLSETQEAALHRQTETVCSIAAELGCKCVIVEASHYCPEMQEYTEEQIFENTVQCLRGLAEIAARHGVGLALEPVGGKQWYVRSLAQCWRIVSAVDSPFVGVALDAFNLYLYDEMRDLSVLDQIPTEKIFTYHLSDSERLPFESLRDRNRVFPGEGMLPLRLLSEKLKAKGYSGPASIELLRPEYWEMSPADVIGIAAAKAKAYL